MEHNKLYPCRFRVVASADNATFRGADLGRVKIVLTPCRATLPVIMGQRPDTMAYTLATAAEAAKVTKPTVFRWIKSGKISATKAEDGTYRIEAAELHRYLDSVAHETLSPETSKQS